MEKNLSCGEITETINKERGSDEVPWGTYTKGVGMKKEVMKEVCSDEGGNDERGDDEGGGGETDPPPTSLW